MTYFYNPSEYLFILTMNVAQWSSVISSLLELKLSCGGGVDTIMMLLGGVKGIPSWFLCTNWLDLDSKALPRLHS